MKRSEAELIGHRLVRESIITKLAWTHGRLAIVDALLKVFGGDYVQLGCSDPECKTCADRRRLMASLPQDGSRGQKNAWDEMEETIASFYEVARQAGWSETVDDPPWIWLISRIRTLESQLSAATIQALAALRKSDYKE